MKDGSNFILGVDTAGAHASVALFDLGSHQKIAKLIAAHDGTGEQSHSEELDLLIKATLTDAGVSVAQIGEIVLGKGPGSFTGLRIGFATVAGLALVHQIPVHTMPSSLGVLGKAGAEVLELESANSVTRVVAPAGKGLVFESILVADRASEIKRFDDLVICAIRNVSEIAPLDEKTIGLAAIVELPKLMLARAIAVKLLTVFCAERALASDACKLAQSGLGLAGLEPDYLRSVAARTILERSVI